MTDQEVAGKFPKKISLNHKPYEKDPSIRLQTVQTRQLQQRPFCPYFTRWHMDDFKRLRSVSK